MYICIIIADNMSNHFTFLYVLVVWALKYLIFHFASSY